jgi:hypothetical protein
MVVFGCGVSYRDNQGSVGLIGLADLGATPEAPLEWMGLIPSHNGVAQRKAAPLKDLLLLKTIKVHPVSLKRALLAVCMLLFELAVPKLAPML